MLNFLPGPDLVRYYFSGVLLQKGNRRIPDLKQYLNFNNIKTVGGTPGINFGLILSNTGLQ